MNYKIVNEAGKARICIEGSISGWHDTAYDFKQQISNLISQGVKDVVLYINSPGGECFEASELVNEIRRFPGTISCEGGALVASAATYIAAKCGTFDMPKNGLIMIHQVSGGCFGKVAELSAYVELMNKLNGVFYAAFEDKCTDKKMLKEKWDTSDWWLTADEAKAIGLVNNVIPEKAIDKTTAQAIVNCGYKGSLQNLGYVEPNVKPKNNEMTVKDMAVQLGVTDAMPEDQVLAMIKGWKKGSEERDVLKSKLDGIQADKISTLVDKAIVDKKITADLKPKWVKALQDNFADASSMLDAINPVVKPATATTAQTVDGVPTKKWEEMTNAEKAKLMDENPAAYEKLLASYCGE